MPRPEYMTIALPSSREYRAAVRRVALAHGVTVGELVRRALDTLYGSQIAHETQCVTGVSRGEEKSAS